MTGAARWLDQYTGRTTFHVATCPATTDCVTISAGKVSGGDVGVTLPQTRHTKGGMFGAPKVSWTTTPIVVDLARATQLGYAAGDRRWLIAHELGHWAGLPHQATRVSFMYPRMNPTPPMTTTTAERKHLTGR